MLLTLLAAVALGADEGFTEVDIDDFDTEMVALAVGGNDPLLLVGTGRGAPALVEAVVSEHPILDLRLLVAEEPEGDDAEAAEITTPDVRAFMEAEGATCAVWVDGPHGELRARKIGTCRPPNWKGAEAFLQAERQGQGIQRVLEQEILDEEPIAIENLPDPEMQVDHEEPEPEPLTPRQVAQISGGAAAGIGVGLVIATWGSYLAQPGMRKGQWGGLRAWNAVGWGLALGGGATFGVGTFVLGGAEVEVEVAPTGMTARF